MVIPKGYVIADKCCDKTRFYDTFDDFPETGIVSRLYVDRETGIIYVWDGTKYITNTIPSTVNEYDTHAEAQADITLLDGNFYTLSEANLEGAYSIGQGGPFYRKL